MNNSCHVQHNNCGKIWLNLSDFLPVQSEPRSAKLSGSLWFSKRKNSAISASGLDCTDRKSCVIRVMFFFCTPLVLFPFVLWSGRLLNVRILLHWIVFDTGMVTWLIVCATYCASAWNSSPSWWTRLRDLMTSFSIITCVSSAKTHDRTGRVSKLFNSLNKGEDILPVPNV